VIQNSYGINNITTGCTEVNLNSYEFIGNFYGKTLEKPKPLNNPPSPDKQEHTYVIYWTPLALQVPTSKDAIWFCETQPMNRWGKI
jgi:hypothetical protein